MRALVSWFFYILGVIFFVLILLGGYFYVTDPFGLREIVPLLTQKPDTNERETDTSEQEVPATVEDKNPTLSASQEAALETIGIDPAALPTSVSDTQKTCMINAVGEARANEIQAGATPTIAEILKAKSCL